MDWLGPLGPEALKYCEASRPGAVKQPANSWSNLAFLIAGWAIAWDQHVRSRHGKAAGHYIILASFSVLIGLGSFIFHASTTWLGLQFDAISMYLLSTFLFSTSVSRWFKSRRAFLPAWLISMGISLYAHVIDVMVGSIDSGSAVFGAFLLLAFFIEGVLIRRQGREMAFIWVALFVSAFGLSLFIWARSQTGGAWCDPHSLIQGHAMWHILDAACLYFVYRYYLSEREIKLTD